MWPLISDVDLEIWRQIFWVISNEISGHTYSNSYILLNFHTNECFTSTELPRLTWSIYLMFMTLWIYVIDTTTFIYVIYISASIHLIFIPTCVHVLYITSSICVVYIPTSIYECVCVCVCVCAVCVCVRAFMRLRVCFLAWLCNHQLGSLLHAQLSHTRAHTHTRTHQHRRN